MSNSTLSVTRQLLAKVVGKMRNCGMWNTKDKMRNENDGKVLWNGG